MKLIVILASLFVSFSISAQERIISTDAAVTEILVSLGVVDNIVATDVTSKVEGANLPSVGYHRTLPTEGMLSLNPTLVIGSENMGPKSTIETIQAAEIDVLQLPEASNVEELSFNIITIGERLNYQAQAEEVVLKVEMLDKALQEAALPRSTKVAFVMAMKGSKMRLAGRGTNAASVIELLGATSVAEYDGYRSISAEGLLALEPEIIIVTGRTASTDLVNTLMADIPLLAYTPAGEADQIIQMDAGALIAGITINTLEALIVLCEQLRGH